MVKNADQRSVGVLHHLGGPTLHMPLHGMLQFQSRKPFRTKVNSYFHSYLPALEGPTSPPNVTDSLASTAGHRACGSLLLPAQFTRAIRAYLHSLPGQALSLNTFPMRSHLVINVFLPYKGWDAAVWSTGGCTLIAAACFQLGLSPSWE